MFSHQRHVCCCGAAHVVNPVVRGCRFRLNRDRTFAAVWMDRQVADSPDIRFLTFADAAYACRCGTLIAALQPMSLDRSLKASLRRRIQTDLSPQPGWTIVERTLPTFDFCTSLVQHPLAGAALFPPRHSKCRHSGRSNGVRQPRSKPHFRRMADLCERRGTFTALCTCSHC